MSRRVQDRAETLRWPQTAEDIQSVQNQLRRMLDDPLFNQSRRYPQLLEYIVEATLRGEIDCLKERTLGIEVFERDPNYDTNSDAIVRVTAAEIRKRIAQYYHEKKHRSEPRIDLPVGAYVAEFAPAEEIEEADEPIALVKALAAEGPPAAEPSPVIPKHPWMSARTRYAIGGVLLLTIIAAVALRVWPREHDDVDSFWGAVLNDKASPLLCVGQLPFALSSTGATGLQIPQNSLTSSLLNQKPISLSDAVVVSEFATFLGTKGIRPSIRVSTATGYADLRGKPVLLVGGLDNNWTLRFLQDLHYRMRMAPNSGVGEIYDSQDGSKNWKLDFNSQRVSEDYAIVSRFYSPSTENTVVIAAGLGENGTAAAVDFLLHGRYLDEIDPTPPSKWKKRNVQVVIQTEVIDGKSGPPAIVARYFW